MKKYISLLLITAFIISVFPFTALNIRAAGSDDADSGDADNGDAALSFSQKTTPLMGWSSWNYYQTNISEEIVIRQIDALIATGLYECGYNFVNIDDGWQNGRDDGVVNEKSRYWPNGMKYIADYAHENGLYAGIYSDGGDTTCGWNDDMYTTDKHVGLYGFEREDLERYLGEWGYDFIKVDWCGGSSLNLNVQDQYTKIGDIISEIEEKYGQDKIYNICCWHFPGEWVTKVADSWRIYGDIAPSFDSILLQIDTVKAITKHTSPGHVNDLDMLQVGNGMSYEEDKTHFSMWCMMSAPLLIGCDVGSISDDALSVLSNKEIIALNQDEACLSAVMVYENIESGYEIWVKSLGTQNDGCKAVAVLNKSDSDLTLDLDFSSIGINGVSAARDLWEHRDIPVINGTLTISVPAHGTDVYKVKGNADFDDGFTFIGNIYETESDIDITASGETDWIIFENAENKINKDYIGSNCKGNAAASDYTFSWTDGENTLSGSTQKGITADEDFIITLPVSRIANTVKLFFSGEGSINIECNAGARINNITARCESGSLYVYDLKYLCSDADTVTLSYSGSG
ncbi:MAG: glycoside hydrolase family 27 protein, partial [Eubacteriales bacterium]|nr:glycoside hydrolase family 27 protein [Eubacteriales bacterium]